MTITTNAGELAAAVRSAGDQLADGLGVEDRMSAAMLAAVRPPRRTGAYAGTVRATGQPGTVSLTAGGGPVTYANIIEFGSRWVPGRKVLMRAVESSEPAWTAIASEGVQQTIDRI